jgi:hypothetical protein
MTEQASVEHTNCSCPNCVPEKMYVEHATLDATLNNGISEIPAWCMLIRRDEHERLKRLDENVKNRIRKANNMVEALIGYTKSGIDCLTNFSHIEHLQQELDLLEGLYE